MFRAHFWLLRHQYASGTIWGYHNDYCDSYFLVCHIVWVCRYVYFGETYCLHLQGRSVTCVIKFRQNASRKLDKLLSNCTNTHLIRTELIIILSVVRDNSVICLLLLSENLYCCYITSQYIAECIYFNVLRHQFRISPQPGRRKLSYCLSVTNVTLIFISNGAESMTQHRVTFPSPLLKRIYFPRRANPKKTWKMESETLCRYCDVKQPAWACRQRNETRLATASVWRTAF